MTRLSVIICAHNPRPSVFGRVLAALRQQTLPVDHWELLIVDSSSSPPLAESTDLSWHPTGRIVREEELGLTPARLRGIAESRSELLVFVDDDNILDPDYLLNARDLAEKFSMIGAFGGSCRGEFETPPPLWIHPYLSGLVVQEISRDHWANAYQWSLACPYGAGICVRRMVADAYAENVRSNALLRTLGRSGRQLLAGEDTDMAWTAIDLGLGTGRFQALKLTHVIPAGRLTEDYVVRLFAGFRYSNTILAASRNGRMAEKARSPLRELLSAVVECARTRGIERRIRIAEWRARTKAWRVLADAERTAGTKVH